MNDTPEWLSHDGEGNATVKLARPLDIDGTKVSSMLMREPSVGDQRTADKMKGSEGDKEVGMFANLCSVTPGDIDRLSLKDYKRLQAAFVNFIS